MDSFSSKFSFDSTSHHQFLHPPTIPLLSISHRVRFLWFSVLGRPFRFLEITKRHGNAYTNRFYYTIYLILNNVLTISICLYITQSAVDLTQRSGPGSNGTL